MRKQKSRRFQDASVVLASVCLGVLALGLVATGFGQAPNPANRAIGAVVSIDPNGFTIQTDSGTRVAVQLQGNATLVRVPPNQKDLKGAVKIAAPDISVGDRVLVRGRFSDDQKTLLANAAIVMSKADIAQKQEGERAAWQRGVGGLVTGVDPAANTITLSTAGFGATKKTTLHSSKDTVLRRYAPDSVRFDDAKPAPFDQIQPGDQLRARGTRSPDGSEFTADEIVSGTFRNIAGTVSSVDLSQNTMTVTDLKTKKPVLVKFATDSQLRKLSPMMAQGIAMRLKGGAPGGPGGQQGGAAAGGGASAGAAPAGSPAAGGSPGGGGPGSVGPGGARSGRAPDLQQILNRMPPAKLADIQKGDAVMIVSTQGTATGGVTAITVLGGVEAILTASPNASQAMFMGAWNLGGGAPSGGGEE